jgi:hypothetical protein
MLRSLGSRHHGVFGRGLSTASQGGGGGGGGGAFVFGGVLALGTVGGLYVFRRDGNIRDQMLAVSPVFGQLEGAIPDLPGAPKFDPPAARSDASVIPVKKTADENSAAAAEAAAAAKAKKEAAAAAAAAAAEKKALAAAKLAAETAAKRAEEAAAAAGQAAAKAEAANDEHVAALVQSAAASSKAPDGPTSKPGTPLRKEQSTDDRLNKLNASLDKLLKSNQGRHFDSIETVLKNIQARDKNLRMEIDSMLVADVIEVRRASHLRAKILLWRLPIPLRHCCCCCCFFFFVFFFFFFFFSECLSSKFHCCLSPSLSFSKNCEY